MQNLFNFLTFKCFPCSYKIISYTVWGSYRRSTIFSILVLNGMKEIPPSLKRAAKILPANPSLAFSNIKVSIQGCILHSKLDFAYQLHYFELVSHMGL